MNSIHRMCTLPSIRRSCKAKAISEDRNNKITINECCRDLTKDRQKKRDEDIKKRCKNPKDAIASFCKKKKKKKSS